MHNHDDAENWCPPCAPTWKKFTVTVIETSHWEYEVEAYDSDEAIERWDAHGDDEYDGEMMSSRKDAESARLIE